MLLPHLERNVELTRRFADCYEGFPGFSHPYDPLLDEYEPEMTTERMRAVLAELREGLVPLVAEATENGAGPGDDPFRGEFPRRGAARADRGADLGAALPGGLLATRPDRAPLRDLDRARRHPARPRATTTTTWRWRCSAPCTRRATGCTRSGVDPELGGPRSRSRARSVCTNPRAASGRTGWPAAVPTSERLLPRLRERFPGAFDEVDAAGLERAANRVERSLIRIEADEVTYNLHILIRFELELEIFEGGLPLADLPEAWNAALPRVPRARGPRRRPRRPPGRALGGRRLRLLPDLQPRQHHRRPALGGRWARPRRPPIADRGAGTWPRSESGCASASTATAAGSLRPRSSSAPGCGELSVEPLLEHLRGRVALAVRA